MAPCKRTAIFVAAMGVVEQKMVQTETLSASALEHYKNIP